jgi:group I intron endonuclease
MIVYLLKCKINQKEYVGKTVSSLDERWREHVSASTRPRCNAHKRMSVVRAIAKHGPENFERSVLEECDTHDELLLAESRHIVERRTTDPNVGYNLTLGGEGIVPTPETRARMSKAQRGRKHTAESKAKMSASHKGWEPSDETRKKMSESKKGLVRSKAHCEALSSILKGRVFTEEHKQKISQARRGRSTKKYPIEVIDPATNQVVVTYESAVEANRLSGGRYKRSSISEACNGKLKTYAGLVWRYLESEQVVDRRAEVRKDQQNGIS